jgi:hypothetical protein
MPDQPPQPSLDLGDGASVPTPPGKPLPHAAPLADPLLTELQLQPGVAVRWVQSRLILQRDHRCWTFHCPPGGEHQTLCDITRAAGPTGGEEAMTWFEAALLSHHVGLRLQQRLQQARGVAGPVPTCPTSRGQHGQQAA